MGWIPGGDWLDKLQARWTQPPRRPRVPLCWQGHRIGSAESAVLHELRLPHWLHPHDDGWEVVGELTPSLARIAEALREAGRLRTWRNEQLAVRSETGEVLGSIERGTVRMLGIPTEAVHLIGFAPDGRQWVQQRALDKADDPGLWDTLVGGMVPASDTVETALERESGEEAGLSLSQVSDVRLGGSVLTERPGSASAGYIIERVYWYTCVVPEGVEPVNRDGEVAKFERMDAGEVCGELERGRFTLEAAMLIAQL